MASALIAYSGNDCSKSPQYPRYPHTTEQQENEHSAPLFILKWPAWHFGVYVYGQRFLHQFIFVF